MNLLYSHWNKEIGSNGYNNFSDFVITLALSLVISKKHFDKVNIVTNSLYKKILVDELEMPFTNIDTSHDELDDLPSWLWGYAKLHALNKQKEEFIHIDNDVILFNGIDKNIQKKQVFFQSLETPFKGVYGYYNPLLRYANNIPGFPKIVKDSPVVHAFNCGVIGMNNLDIMKEWYDLSTSFVRDEANVKMLEKDKELLIHQNLLHEQYFIANICNRRNLKLNKDIGFVIDYEDMYKDANKKGYTHLWGTTKRETEAMKRIKNRLLKESPKYGKFITEKVNQLF